MVKAILVGWILGFACLGAATEDGQPFALPWNRSPVDLRAWLDAPAGKHGYLGIEKEQFVFEDGTLFRPWGITVAGEACFPPHDQSPYLAERIARMGLNLVRFTGMDDPSLQPQWIESFFPVRFNAEKADRLDYFIFQLETRGIYVILDGIRSLKLSLEGGLRHADRIAPGLKTYIHFIPELQELYADYLHALWTHRSRYNQGRQYRDSPSIVFTRLFQDNPISTRYLTIPEYNVELYWLWTDWLQTNAMPLETDFDFDRPTALNQEFLAELTAASYARWHTYLRGLNVKTLISADAHTQDARDLPPLWDMDYISPAGTWNKPAGKNNLVPLEPMMAVNPDQKSHLFSEFAFSRLAGKPFVISGWSEPFPNPFRAELPLWAAALTLLQNWQGAILDRGLSGAVWETEALSADSHWVDPAVIGLMPAAALLFHQRQIPPAETKITMRMDEHSMFQEEPINLYDARPTRRVEQALVEVDIRGKASGAHVYSPTASVDPEEIRAGASPHLSRKTDRQLLLIQTPNLKAVIGNLSRLQPYDFEGFRVHSDESFAVVCAAALDRTPLSDSRDILFTVLSQAQNTDMLTHPLDFGITLIRQGGAPVLIRSTPCRISLQTRRAQARLRVLHGDGRPGEAMPFQIQEGWLSFNAGTHQSIYYRLSFQPSD